MTKKLLSYGEQLEVALELIEKCHKKQKDKAGKPYKLHLVAVKDILVKRLKALKEEEIKNMIAICNVPLTKSDFINSCSLAGLLHDIIEDTDCSFQDLIDLGFDLHIIEAIKLLTKNEIDKEDKYKSYYDRIKQNSIARQVKIADLIHNTTLQRFDLIKVGDVDRTMQYLKHLKFLLQD